MQETFAIECPRQPDQSPSMVRADQDAIEVSLRFDDDTSVANLLPRFLGDCCQFVPPANGSGQQGADFDLWTTECPLNPGSEESACFVRSEQPSL